MMVWFSWLSLILFFLPSPLYSSSFPTSSPPLCHPHESSALLHFKNSFSITNYTSYFYGCVHFYGIANSTASWGKGRDCCTWSGVTCDEVSGHVIRLDLPCSGLEGIIHSNNSLFLLTHLKSLVLSYNYFHGSKLSPLFGRFVSMIHLDLSSSGFMVQVPHEFSHMSTLVTLDLSGNCDLRLETFTIKRMVANFTSLRELSLNNVNMSNVSPHSFMNLSTSLTSLDLSYSKLKGEIPEIIFHLPNLQNLDLSHNTNLTNSFPRYNWSSPLRSLNLSETKFLIDIPYLTKSLKSLETLFLSSCSFKGSYSALLGNLTRITFLDLSRNNFGGQIPWSSLNLERLTGLDLSSNNFIGQLPQICRSTKSITFLSLYDNVFNGTIPSWLYSLPYLQGLDLSGNQFTGHVQEFKSTSLVYLNLGSNKLQGLIPRSIFQQANLSWLDLSSNNFSGVALSDPFSKLKSLWYIDLSFNSLSRDSINSIIRALPITLESLYLSSCGISELPYSLRSLEYLHRLDLSNNRIEGSVPQWFWNVGKDSLFYLNISHNLLTHISKIPWKSLEYIDLSSNRLQGPLPIPPPSTNTFSVSNNQFVEVSSLFCNLTLIQVLDLSNNSLSGNIPPCFGNMSSILTVLDLRMNKFHGMIPPAFVKGNFLRILNLNGNQLEGSLPRSLINCEELEVLDVGNNKLNGPFPTWLETLTELQVLILRANNFYGPLSNPKARCPFQKLRIIDISHNEFSGVLPTKFFESLEAMASAHTDVLEYMGEHIVGGTSYYSVTLIIKGFGIELLKVQKLFITIDLSANNFTGEIPKVIGKLNSLKGLNFSHNNLFGLIPPSLGNLSNLEWLDLSSNELSGNIPFQLAAELKQLEILNLSYNKLAGQIPRGKQFDTFSNDSYGGNVGLCGPPLSKSCEDDEEQQHQGGDDDGDNKSGLIEWKAVIMGYGSGLVIGISVGYMILFSGSFDYWFFKRFGRRSNTHSRRRRRSN